MPERVPIKIVEPDFVPKLIGAIVVFVILLAVASHAGSTLFASTGGKGLDFRNQLISASINAVKAEVVAIRTRLIAVAHAADSENYRAEASIQDTINTAKTIQGVIPAAQNLMDQANQLAKDASAEYAAAPATTDLKMDAETAAQLGSLGLATHAFWKVAWEKSWPFIKQTAIWCWESAKKAVLTALHSIKYTPLPPTNDNQAPANNSNQPPENQPNPVNTAVPAS